MAALAGSLYLVSTVAFCLLCLTIGVRLVLVGHRTGQRPELLLGTGLGLTGGAGYGLLIAVALSHQALGDATSPLLTAATALGKLVHDLGVCAMLAFVVAVFRPESGWARTLAVAMVAVMAIGFAGYALEGGLATGMPGGFWYWLEFSVIGGYPVWAASEAFRYYGLMRRRRALGLADPLVANRFLLWGVGSLLALAAIWTISLPAILGLPLEAQRRMAPVTMSLTAIWGIGCISVYWLTFFPPEWYRARVAAAAG